MSRNFRNFLWFFLGILIFGVPMFAFAATTYPVSVPGVSAVGSGLVYTSRAGIASVVYPSLATTAPLSVPLPSVAGMVASNRQLMVIPAAVAVSVPRVAAAVTNLARIANPIGLGLTLLPIVCAETGICQKATSPTEFETSSGGDPTTAIVKWKPQWVSPYDFTSVSNLCSYDLSLWPGGYECTNVNEQTGTYGIKNTASGAILGRAGTISKSCPSGYTLTPDGSCLADSIAPHAPTDPEWEAAAAKLATALNRMPDMVKGLQDAGQPVPIDKPVLSPVSSTTNPTSVVNRGAVGNIINTTTTSITTTVSPVTNTSTTNTVNVTQITNTTVTDPTGATTGTTQTSGDPPPPEDTEIEFDTVPDSDLTKQDFPGTLNPVSWGEGSCPPDPVVTVLGHPIAVPVHVVCQYMTGVRTAVIAVFALIAAYIVVGVKFEG